MTQAHYRNTAIELEPGRYSRDEWRLELARAPSSRAKRTQSTAAAISYIFREERDEQPVDVIRIRRTPFTFEECAPTRGLYTIVEHSPDHRSGRALLARCGGKICGGHTRRFTYAEWQVAAQACHRCAHASRYDLESIPPTSGLFKLERVYRNEDSRVVIDAACTGPGCGGTTRRSIRVDAWMRGLKRCQVCANVSRRIERGAA